MKQKMAKMIGISFLGLVLLCGIYVPAFASVDTQGYTAEDCIQCHKTGSGESSLEISIENYDASLHGQSVSCLDCHIGITNEDHMETENVVPVDCKGCHEMETGKMDLFSILSSSQIVSHKKANFTNIYEMDNCLGCHQGKGAHGEVDPIKDQDCYKCHDPDIKAAMWGYIHPETKNRSMTAMLAHMFFYVFILIQLFGWFLMPVIKNSPKNKTKKPERDKL